MLRRWSNDPGFLERQLRALGTWTVREYKIKIITGVEGWQLHIWGREGVNMSLRIIFPYSTFFEEQNIYFTLPWV